MSTHSDSLKFTSYSKRQRIRIRHGFCCVCGEPRGTTGTTIRCFNCAKSHNVARSAAYAARVEAGQCGHCGRPRQNLARAHCDTCITKLNARSTQRALACVKKNLCRQCTKPLDRDGVYCTACNDWRNECWRAKRKANSQPRARKPGKGEQNKTRLLADALAIEAKAREGEKRPVFIDDYTK